MKNIFIAFLVCPLMFLASCSDSKDGDALLGTWDYMNEGYNVEFKDNITPEYIYFNEPSVMLGSTLSFEKDNTFRFLRPKKEPEMGTYHTKKNKLTVTTLGVSKEYEYSFEEGRLFIEFDILDYLREQYKDYPDVTVNRARVAIIFTRQK